MRDARIEELYRRLEQVRRHVGTATDDVTKGRMITLVADLEREIADIEAAETDTPSSKEIAMTEDWHTLKQQLDETTDRWKQTEDPEAKDLLGADVRELERLIEIVAEQDTGSPREQSRHL